MKAENYKEFFTKDYMMGPNSICLLDEMIEKNPKAIKGGRILDLGCGMGITSLYLARETTADEIFATDLWISASENQKNILKWELGNKIIPIHANANDLPFADNFFDGIVSVDSYHYYGCEKGFFAEKIMPLMKSKSYALIAIPGLKEEITGEMPQIMLEWANEEASFFHSADWWRNHIAEGTDGQVDITVYESEHFQEVWENWIQSGHEYALRDKAFLEQGLKDLLNFIFIIICKK